MKPLQGASRWNEDGRTDGLTFLGQLGHQLRSQQGEGPSVPQRQGQDGQDPADHHLLSGTFLWTHSTMTGLHLYSLTLLYACCCSSPSCKRRQMQLNVSQGFTGVIHLPPPH